MLGSPVARRWAHSEINRSLNQFLQDTYCMLGAVIHTEDEGFQVRQDPHSRGRDKASTSGQVRFFQKTAKCKDSPVG